MTSPNAERIRKLFLEHFAVEESRLLPEATVESLGLDSLDMVDFFYTIEKEFHIKLPEREMRLSTLQDIIDLVNTLQKEQGQTQNPTSPSR